jgi:hypothetical protein
MQALVPARTFLRGTLQRAIHAAVSVIAAFGSGHITFAEFLEELEALGLKGRTFGPEDYRQALERHLGFGIELVLVPDTADPAARRAFVEAGASAVLWYRPDPALARILVLSSLPALEMTAAVYHELSHLAAGHRLRPSGPSAGDLSHLSLRRPRLAWRPPPAREAASEREASVRERYCMLAGALGAACLEDDGLRQVR